MNENLDDFLNRMGIEQAASDDAEAVEITEESTTSIVSAASTPENMSEDEFNHLLNEVGFQNPPEAEAVEIHDGSDDTTEWEEENSEEEYNEDRDRAAEERTASVSSSEQEAVHVGNGIIAQIQDIGSGLNFDGENIVAEGGTIVANRDNLEAMSATVPVLDLITDQEVHLHMPDDIVIEEYASQEANTSPVPEVIPENSPTLTIDDTTSRFSGAEWYDTIRNTKIILAGLGGIGRI